MISIFAAAGLAEAAWAMAACLMVLVMVVVVVVSLFAFALRSQTLALVAFMLQLLATVFFQPWHCFAPFEESAYADPDVRSAAEMFRTVGILWAVTSAAALGSLLFASLLPKKDPLATAALGEGGPKQGEPSSLEPFEEFLGRHKLGEGGPKQGERS